jgi:hypothetical protein
MCLEFVTELQPTLYSPKFTGRLFIVTMRKNMVTITTCYAINKGIGHLSTWVCFIYEYFALV